MLHAILKITFYLESLGCFIFIVHLSFNVCKLFIQTNLLYIPTSSEETYDDMNFKSLHL